MDGIKILAFDTGGTILDWHCGISVALAECGGRRGVTHDCRQRRRHDRLIERGEQHHQHQRAEDGADGLVCGRGRRGVGRLGIGHKKLQDCCRRATRRP